MKEVLTTYGTTPFRDKEVEGEGGREEEEEEEGE